MSGLKKAIFGESGTPSRVVDSTPDEFARLRSPLAAGLQGALQNPNQFQGQFTAPLGGGEVNALQGVNQAAGQLGQGLVGPGFLAGATQFNPFAGASGLEQFGLGNVAQQAFGQNPLLGQAQGFLGQQLGGQFNPFAGAAGLTGAEQQGLGAVQQQAFGANPLTGTVNQTLQNIAGGQNPLTDQLIQSAQRPILDNFSDQALAQRGLFTGAGQQVQGQGSSPFAQASARLAGNTQNALNDASLGVTNQAFQQQLAGLGLAQQQPGIQLQNQLAGLRASGLPREVQQLGLNLQNQAFQQQTQNQFGAAGLADQLGSNALTRSLLGLEAAGGLQGRQAQAFENQQGRQLQAGGALGQQQLQAQQAQLEGQLQNLQAQGLPRLVQQLGIDAGLQEFQRQQAEMLQLIQLMAGVSSPSTAVLPGTPGTPGALSSFAGGFGQAFGQSLSDRRAKRDIEHVATTPSGTKLYRFRYTWDDVNRLKRLGVMADEVAHIPGAVQVDEITGLATVDLAKVA